MAQTTTVRSSPAVHPAASRLPYILLALLGIGIVIAAIWWTQNRNTTPQSNLGVSPTSTVVVPTTTTATPSTPTRPAPVVTRDTVAPGAPTQLRVTQKSPTSVSLAWKASTDNRGVSGYDIFRDNASIARGVKPTSFSATGLSPNTTYTFMVQAKDVAGNTSAGASITVTTASGNDVTVPTISTPTAINISSTSVQITWTTNEPATSEVEYGTDTNFGRSVVIQTRRTSHAVVLNDLRSGTNYYYRIGARDAAGNLAFSENFGFTTAGTPDTSAPVISNIRVTAITDSAATLSWDTNEPAQARLDYGTDTNYGQNRVFTTFNTHYSVRISNLTSSTVYHYQIQATDRNDNVARSGDLTFRTLTRASITITNPISGSTVSSTVTVSAGLVSGGDVGRVVFSWTGNGVTKTITDTAAPFSFVWDTTQESNGTYTIVARAYTAEGSDPIATSGPVTVTVSNP